jgi:hypothetical protein
MFFSTGLPGWMRFGRNPAPYAEQDPEMEKRVLRDQADALKAEMEYINGRLSKLEAGSKDE